MKNFLKMRNAIISRATFMRVKRKIISRVWVVRTLMLGVVVLVVSIVAVLSFFALRNTRFGNSIKIAQGFIKPNYENIKIIDGRINILVLGKAGEGYDAPDLTDSLTVLSIDVDKKKTYLFSVPRDIWIENLKTKINSLYYYGNKKTEGGGLVLAKNVVSEIMGIPIQYSLAIDFDGFKKIIDVLGGVDVQVKNGFTDEKFPIPGKENDECGGDTTFSCRYEKIAFEKGIIHMNGETALKYSRSRHAEGDEGDDFARSARQQEIFAAIKEKLLSKEILLNPKKIKNLLGVVNTAVERDFDDSTAASISRYIYESRRSINQFGLDESLFDIVTGNPKYENLYVLVPKDDNWTAFQENIKCKLEIMVCN
ncbi:MAG: Cell envelope-related transcriptional attenuator [Microgenomates group bacterium GW2011_GWC1_37_12b]|uniref:Cell envelope-related transcriptional attenuator n=2 Tax=Candidatus Woeseibacteriota TaxID=1752722 RepID=A0A0G0LFD8_9BACT|nr:MAG: Cell envelope-related transcriptional attenuator [Microgenomates group bacterium GW2011_GWC1_37_12b]KKQ86645.1 MAG: Cell envelope-related transcriptional attenuator [Candidatus Woesebacteria bacterium GW2011_GWB1_38_8b]